MTIIRPRLNDYFEIPISQEFVSFAIPFLEEDIPLYVDPFLLWKSPSQQDNSLHTMLVNTFNGIGYLYSKKRDESILNSFINLTECNEVGLGDSKKKTGKRIGIKTANDLLSLYNNIPQLTKYGFQHFEEIQLLVNNISKDRVSDITCSILKSFLIDYTTEQCVNYNIPMSKVIIHVFDTKKLRIIEEEAYLPVQPNDNRPILFVPKRWLRYIPWVNYDDYFENYYIKDISVIERPKDRIDILDYNRKNYDLISTYIKEKEKTLELCHNDPLFKQIPILSVKRKLSTIIKLPTGKTANADRLYEDNLCQLLTSLFYPHLDFAQEQSRTESGSQIRDLVFYNSCSTPFLQSIYTDYQCKQVVVELKNVNKLEREHINQVNRYLSTSFGKFGIIFTRNRPPKNIVQNTIDLWAGQRICILIMTDEDLSQMCEVFESKNRSPIEFINKKYVEFIRSCPS